jgi:hypothetical protein
MQNSLVADLFTSQAESFREMCADFQGKCVQAYIKNIPLVRSFSDLRRAQAQGRNGQTKQDRIFFIFIRTLRCLSIRNWNASKDNGHRSTSSEVSTVQVFCHETLADGVVQF